MCTLNPNYENFQERKMSEKHLCKLMNIRIVILFNYKHGDTCCSSRLLASSKMVSGSTKMRRCLSTCTSHNACNFCLVSNTDSDGSQCKKYVVFLRFTLMNIAYFPTIHNFGEIGHDH